MESHFSEFFAGSAQFALKTPHRTSAALVSFVRRPYRYR